MKSTVLSDTRDEFFKNTIPFGCLTGLYYSGIHLLKVKNVEAITYDDGGEYKTGLSIVSNRSKNDQGFVDPVFSYTEEILKEFPTGQVMHLSSKVYRHTFAEIMISLNVSYQKVGRALGHTKVSTTEIYGRQSKENARRGWIEFKL